MIHSIIISTVGGIPVVNWVNKSNLEIEERHSFLTASVISAIQSFTEQVFLRRLQRIEMDKDVIILKGIKANTSENSKNVEQVLVASALVDKIDHHRSVDSILDSILKKALENFDSEHKTLFKDIDLQQWIDDHINKRIIKKPWFRGVIAFILIVFSFFIATLFSGINYGLWVDKTIEESLQALLGVISGLLLVICCSFIAGARLQALIATMSAVPLNFLLGDYFIRYVLTSDLWEKSIGNNLIFLGFFIFVGIIGALIGGYIAEIKHIYK